MNESTEDSPLLRPMRLGELELPNRVIMAPLTRCRAGDGDVPTALHAEYYRQRASAGLIISEGSPIAPTAVGYPRTPGIYTDAQLRGWQAVTRAVHHAGGRIFLQLWHVGRISHASYQPDGLSPVAPSAIAAEGFARTPGGRLPYPTPQALDEAGIARVVREFADGARRAREAGFDGIEIHGANGYLIDQFLRDGTNRRRDRYGGSAENRIRFLVEVTQAVLETWPASRVGVRLAPVSPFHDMSDSSPEDTFGRAAERLSELGIGYVHIVEIAGTETYDRKISRTLRQRFHGALMVNGGYDLAEASATITGGRADLVSFGRLFLANPDLPRRFALGAPLNVPDSDTFYVGEERGYTDYPFLGEASPGS